MPPPFYGSFPRKLSISGWPQATIDYDSYPQNRWPLKVKHAVDARAATGRVGIEDRTRNSRFGAVWCGDSASTSISMNFPGPLFSVIGAGVKFIRHDPPGPMWMDKFATQPSQSTAAGTWQTADSAGVASAGTLSKAQPRRKNLLAKGIAILHRTAGFANRC